MQEWYLSLASYLFFFPQRIISLEMWMTKLRAIGILITRAFGSGEQKMLEKGS